MPPSPATPALAWIAIPGGYFTMGSSDADMQKTLAECNATEGADTGQSCQAGWFKEPQRAVNVGDFQIARDETSNAQYNACVAAGVCRKAGERISDNTIAYEAAFFADTYPVVGVNLNDATTFCQWVGGRLPTEVEWERAARGSNGRRYPWGDTFDSSRANLGSGHPSPVGSFPAGASPYGVLDMAGNVFEWTATQEGGNYVIRGGGWSKYYFRGRVTDRGTQLAPDFANYDVGFRCAR
jgi:formylglycine-generating enzyme required for sulfatase activity